MLSSDIAQICMKLKYINIILIDMGIPLNGQVQATAHNNNHLWDLKLGNTEYVSGESRYDDHESWSKKFWHIIVH